MVVVYNYPYLLTGINTAPVFYFQGEEREEREERGEVRRTVLPISRI
tara:strand:+ start:92 stop:232 length:141 start_codon:yes stop_codon:yes gene_type:complete